MPVFHNFTKKSSRNCRKWVFAVYINLQFLNAYYNVMITFNYIFSCIYNSVISLCVTLFSVTFCVTLDGVEQCVYDSFCRLQFKSGLKRFNKITT